MKNSAGNKNYRIVLFIFLIFNNFTLMSAESLVKKFSNIHYPVKIWVILHPFAAKKALNISEEAKKIASNMVNSPELDGDYAGGQVDAFRHLYWMARLTQEIGKRKAKSLGIAYEKSNKIDFEKKLLEDNYLPDYISSKMDLENNLTGIQIGLENKDASPEILIKIIIKSIHHGRAVIIKKNKQGKFLDKKDNIIPEENYLAKWYSPKTLVSSDYVRP